MYSRDEISRTKEDFWTRFGQYMSPVKNAAGESINWMNYKTGKKNVFFRMEASRKEAFIAIELHHGDKDDRLRFFNLFTNFQDQFTDIMQEGWVWNEVFKMNDGKIISKIEKKLSGVDVMQQGDWPVIISFLKPRIISLDQFWFEVRDFFV